MDTLGSATGAAGSWWPLAVIGALVLFTACGANGDLVRSSTLAPAVTPAETTEPPSISTSVDASRPSTAPTPASAGTTDGDAVRRSVTVGELVDGGVELVDVAVDVRARAFLLQSCPPPGGTAAVCSVAVLLIDPETTDLLYGDRNQAVSVSTDGRRVICDDVADHAMTCAGWQHLTVYEISGVVRRTVGEPAVELEVQGREPA